MDKKRNWFAGNLATSVGAVPRISVKFSIADIMGAIKVRLDVGRMDYAVEPGLYAVGNPLETSPVLVSANYKLSFDYLRKELSGLDVWILVLDTKGVNVWCAAGKGTFGTAEIVRRVQSVGLDKVVSHRKLILPQLSAPGVAAHKVKGDCGFQVIYGPVRAADIKNFLKAGMKTTPEMRCVRFDFLDRLVVIPVEIIQWVPHVLLLGLVMAVLSGITSTGYEVNIMRVRGFNIFMITLAAFLGGSILVPALLPWLPGKAFSTKGMLAGFMLWGILVLSECAMGIHFPLEAWAWLPLILTITSFMAMNFTGCSTFTSQSGVKREMRYAVPIQILLLVSGIALWIKTGLL